MRKFSIRISNILNIYYNHYLSDKFIKGEEWCYFKENCPLSYLSRKFDKPAEKLRDGSCFWCLDNKLHREGKPAIIWANGKVGYFENGERVK